MRLLSCFLSLMLCIGLFSGCAGTSASSTVSSAPVSSSQPSETSPDQQNQTLKIGYSKSNGFNPYLSNDSLVLQASDLVSEKLVEITPEMGVEYRLATSITSSGLSVVITLRQDAVFADGTPVTANDVAACINAARTSATYAGAFAHVTDVQVIGEQVQLTLSRDDSLFECLCTIPIIKESELALPQPTASGRYTYGSDGTLVKNPRSLFGEEQAVETIQLMDVSGFDALVSGLSVGSLDLYTTTHESVNTSAYTSRSTTFNMNHLIFLGVNSSSSSFLAQPVVRTAISTAIDREILCERAYYSAAIPARGAINPLYSCVTGKQSIPTTSNLSLVQKTMEKLGYTRSATDGFYRDANGSRPELRLLVCTTSALKRSAATLIKEQLTEAGFAATLEETDDFAGVYSQKIANGEFDLYIGEVKLYNNMDMSPFFENGAVSFGIAQSPELLNAYTAFTQNSDNAEAFEDLFAQQLSWIPLCWRSGTLVVNKQLTSITPSCSNTFYSMQPALPAE